MPITAILKEQDRPTIITLKPHQVAGAKKRYGDRLRILGEMEQQPAAVGTATVQSNFGEYKPSGAKASKSRSGAASDEETPPLDYSPKAIICVTTGAYYANVIEAQKATGAKKGGIYNVLHKRQTRAGGLAFRYATEEEKQKRRMLG